MHAHSRTTVVLSRESDSSRRAGGIPDGHRNTLLVHIHPDIFNIASHTGRSSSGAAGLKHHQSSFLWNYTHKFPNELDDALCFSLDHWVSIVGLALRRHPHVIRRQKLRFGQFRENIHALEPGIFPRGSQENEIVLIVERFLELIQIRLEAD